MVRFSWHVEDGFLASVPPGGIEAHSLSKDIWHLTMHTEVAGQKDPLVSLITLPKQYMGDDTIRSTGIVIAHGTQPDHKGKLLTELAVALASQGFAVVRYYCKSKEQRRVRDLEKTLDAMATSPFARCIKQWALLGLHTGARVAACVLNKCRGTKAALVCITYPLRELPSAGKKGEEAPVPSGESPLLQIQCPILFVRGSDDLTQCPLSELLLLSTHMHSRDVRVAQIKGVDGHLRTHNARLVSAATREKIITVITDYLNTIDPNTLSTACTIPTAAALHAGPVIDAGPVSSPAAPHAPSSSHHDASPNNTPMDMTVDESDADDGAGEGVAGEGGEGVAGAGGGSGHVAVEEYNDNHDTVNSGGDTVNGVEPMQGVETTVSAEAAAAGGGALGGAPAGGVPGVVPGSPSVQTVQGRVSDVPPTPMEMMGSSLYMTGLTDVIGDEVTPGVVSAAVQGHSKGVDPLSPSVMATLDLAGMSPAVLLDNNK